MRVNVYDFDGTIYRGDSSADFCMRCFLRYPRAALSILASLPWFLGVMLRLVAITRAKERLYRFLRFVPDVDVEVAAFWRGHTSKLKAWYLAQKQPSDIIVSASPEFLLDPVAQTLGVRLIGSRVASDTGRYTGRNCSGAEKVERFGEAYPDLSIASFYSDRRIDAPLARLAEKSYLVRGERLEPFFD